MSTNPVLMRDVGTMVHSVIVRLAGARMNRLNIVDHGNEKGFEVGDDVVTAENIGRYSATLAQLRGRFAPNGFVHLQHCKVGAILLSAVPVVATASYMLREWTPALVTAAAALAVRLYALLTPVLCALTLWLDEHNTRLRTATKLVLIVWSFLQLVFLLVVR
jgi:hypothetical protein